MRENLRSNFCAKNIFDERDKKRYTWQYQTEEHNTAEDLVFVSEFLRYYRRTNLWQMKSRPRVPKRNISPT